MEDDDSLKLGSAMYKLLYKVVERCLWDMSDLLLARSIDFLFGGRNISCR